MKNITFPRWSFGVAVASRGNDRKAIFRDDQDRDTFLELLGPSAAEFHLRLPGYAK